MFRSLYVGSFTESELVDFLEAMSVRSGHDLAALRPEIESLAGRFPYFDQVVGALFLERAERGPLTVTPALVERVAAEFRDRVENHFEDIWSKLPESERDALRWLSVSAHPESRDALAYNQALPSLRRRGYVVGDRIFSSVFEDYVRQQLLRIELNKDTGEVRVEKRLVELPPKEFALLRFLLDNEGEVVTKEDIATAVWPEYRTDALGVTDAMIQKTISRLRKEVDLPDGTYQHIESIRGQGYRIQNASVYEVYHHRGNGDA
jgi:DNA-binding response OmpR family regulator